MKKLFALLVVSGMVFVSCNNNQAAATVEEDATVEEATIEETQQEDAAEMVAPEQAEEAQPE